MNAKRPSRTMCLLFLFLTGIAGCSTLNLTAAEQSTAAKQGGPAKKPAPKTATKGADGKKAEPGTPGKKPAPKADPNADEEPAAEEVDAGEGVPPEARRRFGSRLAGFGSKTLGGVQLWDDLLLFQKWRIQKHALFGFCRLLDGDDVRHARGSYEQCLEKLEEIKRERKLPGMKGKAVVVLHGLGGWRGSMQSLVTYIEKNSDYTVFSVGYASTRDDVASHAERLAGIIEHLDGIEEINFVAHSLGNVIVRRYLGDLADAESSRKPGAPIKRYVMIAPPNHGAAAAEAWSDNDLFELVLGDSAVELGAGWPEVAKKLVTPACEFGIIAGGKGDDRGYNSRLKGDNDGLLSVSTTKLVGARDFVLVPVLHPFSTMNAQVQEYTVRFLQEGYFISADERHPITEEE